MNEPSMKRASPSLPLAFAVATALALVNGPARAADPTTPECLAATDASLKLDTDHKLRAERSQLLVCAAPSCPADISKECIRRVEQVNAALPTVIFQARDAAGNDLSAVKVSMDGEVLAEKLDGTPLSVDPGEHAFVFETAGQPASTRQFVIFEAQKDRRVIVDFSPASPPPPPLIARARHGLGTQRILGIVAASVGVLGLGTGAAFGVSAISKKNDAEAICPNKCNTDAGVNAWNDAVSTANLSTALFIVGGVGIAGATVLFLTAPSSKGTPSAQVGFGLGGVQLKGSW